MGRNPHGCVIYKYFINVRTYNPQGSGKLYEEVEVDSKNEKSVNGK